MSGPRSMREGFEALARAARTPYYVELDAAEREILADAIHTLLGVPDTPHAGILAELRERIRGPVRDPRPTTRDLTRAQELAADAMAAKYGRSGVQCQADGSVVVSGLLDDVVMERVCVELDGQERWRDR